MHLGAKVLVRDNLRAPDSLGSRNHSGPQASQEVPHLLSHLSPALVTRRTGPLFVLASQLAYT